MAAKRFVNLGETITQPVAYSEVAMHMRVAGKPMAMRLIGGATPMVQLLDEQGQPFSAPITPGEAGLYYDDATKGYYAVVEQLDADGYVHTFNTFLGLPPGTDEDPMCGAKLAEAWSGRNKPACPACATAMAAAQTTQEESK